MRTDTVEKIRRKLKKTRGRTVSVICVGFLILICIGTLLLCMPFSSANGDFTSPLTALFTATSATCVTGLNVVTCTEQWSIVGQIIILLLIQIGGLGFMTLAMMVYGIIRRAMTPKDRMLVAMSYNLDSYESIGELVRRILLGTFAIEFSGAVLLFTQFVRDFSLPKAIFASIFTSVSAFCNAGFDIIGAESVAPYAGNICVMLVLTFLICIGGIGFIVWNDLINLISKHKRMSVYTRFVLLVSAVLFAGGALTFAIAEWNNPATIGNFHVWQKIIDSIFQSATYRTAGFAIFDNGGMSDGAKLLGIVWMFVGGASGSTAGGVKVATVGILLYTVWSVAFGKKETVVFGRKISRESFVRAVSVVVVQLVLIILGTVILCSTDGVDIMDSLFEVTSAISTVGLTLGITPSLGAAGRILIVLLMYFGRVGVLSVTYAVMTNMSGSQSSITYPDANMLIG